MTSVSQKDRRGQLHTPLPPDQMVLLSFDGTEALNSIYEFQVEAMSTVAETDLDGIVGKEFTVEIKQIDNASRFFSGILTDVRALGLHEGGMGYLLTLRPKLWLLGLRRNQRIFHQKSPQDIITEVLSDHGIQAEFTGIQDAPLEYTVQHGESDLAFVSRMMERFGYNYYHTFEMGSHKLKIDGTRFSGKPMNFKREIIESSGQHRNPDEHFVDWIHDRRITTGAVKLTDYNFEKPNASLVQNQAGDAKYAYPAIEAYDYPGGYLEGGPGKSLAKLRLEAERGKDGRHFARGDVLSAGVGTAIEVKGLNDNDVDGKTFVVLSASHHYDAEGFRTGGSERGDADAYRGSYEFLPNTVPVVPTRKTPLSVIPGPQVAKVIAEPNSSSSSEIDVDKYGRILVKFPWDLNTAGSMRCRVVQPWAGNKWGNIQIPRIGMEVLVQFLMGDPDNPVIVGCLYNGENMPPYELPGEHPTAGIKSKTLGGDGYNEFVMIDKAGDELIRVHAQHDMDSTIENDERRQVKHDQTLTVDNDQTSTIKHDQTLNVDNDQKITVKSNRTQTVNKDKKTTVDLNYDIEAKMKYELKVGMCKLMMDGTQIVLSIGASKITMNATEVKIQGINVENQGSAAAKVSAGGMVQVQGGLVKIN